MSRFTLNRRTMLRGILGGSAVAVGLPALDAMLNNNGTAMADGTGLPVRFISFYWADGCYLDRFEPTTAGATWSLAPQMAPLTALKDYLNVITGLANHSQNAKTHHEGMTVFNGYTYQDTGGLSSNAGGPTVDQLIADAIAARVSLPQRDVHIRISKRQSTDGDGGTTYDAMSHRGSPGSLVNNFPEDNPQTVWSSVFGMFAEPVDTRPPRLRVLDAVREDSARLRSRLGTKDQQRLDAHLQAVDELETKISAATPSCELPGMPTETNTDSGGEEPITSVNQAMASLVAYAFACDLFRVASYMLKHFVSATVFDEINATDIHHNSSHSSSFDSNYDAGVTYQMAKFAELLQALHDTPDATGGNLLDSTIVYASSDCSTPFSHSIDRQPVILAGHGRNYLKFPGVHYTATPFSGSNNNPNSAGNNSDALLTCLRAFDSDAASIGGDACVSSSVISDVIA